MEGMAAFSQFLLVKRVWDSVKGKFNKIPVSPHTLVPYPKKSNWQQDPSQTTTAEVAMVLAANLGNDYGVAFLFTDNDPFYFLDLDNCLASDGSGWTPEALAILGYLPGAAIEISMSGKGLHAFGTGQVPIHGCKNGALGFEFYTTGRIAALTGQNMVGDCLIDSSATLPALIANYFPPSAATSGTGKWSTEAVPGWAGITDDAELIKAAKATQSGRAIFGKAASFADLWDANEDVFSVAYPDNFGNRSYDGSLVDAALAQHLAFWTGGNCARILDLMWQSELVREKWDREKYIENTISLAVSRQISFHGVTSTKEADAHGAAKLKGSSESQINFATTIREQKLATATQEEATILATQTSAKFWLNSQDANPSEMVAMTATAATVSPKYHKRSELVSGFQYFNATMQQEHFAGCVYIQDLHRIYTPSGAMLKSEQFNAVYGGYVFQLDEMGDKTTRKAWDAFTESQAVRFPKAESSCFRPELAQGEIIDEEGITLVNTYVPLTTDSAQGDISMFLTHLGKVLPDVGDQAILLAYMSACIQYKGVKFQWAPLIQGVEGNGKTLFTRCVAFAIGNRYTHLPPSNEISEKFNEWLFNKLFIGIEDVYVPDHKKEILEVLKPMITNDRLAMRAMQQSQVMGDNRANFMLNSNHKDGLRKTRNDRRFSMFFTAQQSDLHLRRDGMDGDYFPKLYHWLREEGGYSAVAHFLGTYAIPDALNPATKCHRAPDTSSTYEAINAGLGSIEQEIMEAIEEGRPGFAGGWISSVALDRLLMVLRAARSIPQNKRRDVLLDLGYDWHPALHNGRVNNPIAIDDHKKPRLYIKRGHIANGITSSSDAVKNYIDAQNSAINAIVVSEGVQVFGK